MPNAVLPLGLDTRNPSVDQIEDYFEERGISTRERNAEMFSWIRVANDPSRPQDMAYGEMEDEDLYEITKEYVASGIWRAFQD